ncbi:UDP-N-acetylmuramyl pentapeptide phosphotransferase [Brevibacillus sp. SAFN-007a]|uniref:UDP-N-acetylmuramyl pentapeptide phosphotransferase n=1 Tax=Brevibacillus sp. SAFN-007a TaxID=3436862 RepID=UPI003F7EDC15
MGAHAMTLALIVGIAWPLVLQRPLLTLCSGILAKKRMIRPNYRGEQVLTAGGLVLVASTAVTILTQLVLLTLAAAPREMLLHGLLLAGGMAAMAWWGWIDDKAGDQVTKGFRGHFAVLWRERRVTSGMGKLLGGGLTAVSVSLFVSVGFWPWLLACGLLAISPNILNLFDLRPGRAIKVFWLLMMLAVVVSVFATKADAGEPLAVWLFLLPVLVASMLFFPHDAGGRIMLGDTGANTLGFAIGYTYVTVAPLFWQAVFLTGFVAIQVAAEFVSFSRLIDKQAWLSRLDQWGR